MKSKKSISGDISKIVTDEIFTSDELANLKKVSEIDNVITCDFDDLLVCTASIEHIKEVAELWANLASIQQIFAPERYCFKKEEKNWQNFVQRKLDKKNNLLLVAQNKNNNEVRGFLYLQTIVLPSSDLVLKGVIEDIYTKPQYRRHGVARRLLSVSLDWAYTQNIKQIDFVVVAKLKELSLLYLNFIKDLRQDIKLDLLAS